MMEGSTGGCESTEDRAQPRPQSQGASSRPGGQDRILKDKQEVGGATWRRGSSRHRKQRVQKLGKTQHLREMKCLRFPVPTTSWLQAPRHGHLGHPPEALIPILEVSPFPPGTSWAYPGCLMHICRPCQGCFHAGAGGGVGGVGGGGGLGFFT